MKKDINPPKVKDVAVAIVKDKNDEGEDIWNAYIINYKKEAINEVLVTSKGYLTDVKGNETKTSTLRHAMGTLAPNDYAIIEPIMENVFALHNEYWVSFFGDKGLLDKKFVFLAETIKEENLITIPVLNKQGVMIK
ncbi:MAG: hypothetical protein ACPGSO_08525 [Vicingaceae bacterium]